MHSWGRHIAGGGISFLSLGGATAPPSTELTQMCPYCLASCSNLTSVELPTFLTEVGHGFLVKCIKLQSVDLRRTTLHKIGRLCAAACTRLTLLLLPDTVTDVGDDFLLDCGRVEVAGLSSAVQAALGRRELTVFLWAILTYSAEPSKEWFFNLKKWKFE